MSTQNSEKKFIDLKELCQILHFTDVRSVQKWCAEKNIEIQIFGKKRLVHKFLVNLEIDHSLVTMLKEKYPLKWESLYKCYLNDDRLNYLRVLANDASETKDESIEHTSSSFYTKYAKALSE